MNYFVVSTFPTIGSVDFVNPFYDGTVTLTMSKSIHNGKDDTWNFFFKSYDLEGTQICYPFEIQAEFLQSDSEIGDFVWEPSTATSQATLTCSPDDFIRFKITMEPSIWAGVKVRPDIARARDAPVAEVNK